MTNIVVNVTQIRDNLAEILGRVRFGEEIVTVEKKGKPYAVIMSPEEYKRYKKISGKAFWATVDRIRTKNATVNEEEVMEDVTKAVEEVRQERYERGK
jgi:prevent-host-death family protein